MRQEVLHKARARAEGLRQLVRLGAQLDDTEAALLALVDEIDGRPSPKNSLVHIQRLEEGMAEGRRSLLAVALFVGLPVLGVALDFQSTPPQPLPVPTQEKALRSMPQPSWESIINALEEPYEAP